MANQSKKTNASNIGFNYLKFLKTYSFFSSKTFKISYTNKLLIIFKIEKKEKITKIAQKINVLFINILKKLYQIKVELFISSMTSKNTLQLDILYFKNYFDKNLE